MMNIFLAGAHIAFAAYAGYLLIFDKPIPRVFIAYAVMIAFGQMAAELLKSNKRNRQ
jgi:hypothetical protein